MKQALLALLILLSTTINAQKDIRKQLAMMFATPDTEQKIAMNDSAEWTRNLNVFFVNHENPNIAVFGLRALASEYKVGYVNVAEDSKDFSALSDFANTLLLEEGITAQSLMFIDLICDSKPIKGACAQDVLDKKMSQINGDNITILLNDLEQASIENNADEIAEILNSMSKSKYSNSYNYLSEVFIEVVKNYINENPFPDNVVANQLKLINKSTRFSETTKEYIINDPKDFMLVTKLIGYKMALPIPGGYRKITDLCGKEINYAENCLKIANMLKFQNFDYIGNAVGRNIKTVTLELSGTDSEIDKAKLEQETFKKQLDCTHKISRYSDEYNFNLFNTLEMVHREQGEMAMYMKWSQLSYENQIKNGNDKAIDPKTCFEH